MPFMNCKKLAEIVTDEASAQFAPLLKENPQRKQFLKACCDEIDTLVPMIDADSLSVEVDDVETTVTISMECDEIIMESDRHKLYEISGKAAEVRFSVSQENPWKLLISFVFPGIWEHA